MDYGADPVFLVLADVTNPQHNQLNNQNDVTSIIQYANLDNTVPANAVTAVRNGLEALNIPGNWVDSTDTWRFVMRIVMSCFQFQQRVHGMNGRSVFREGVDLSRTWSSLPVGIRTDIQAAADSFGWDYSSLTGASTLREVLRTLAIQWGSEPFVIGGYSV